MRRIRLINYELSYKKLLKRFYILFGAYLLLLGAFVFISLIYFDFGTSVSYGNVDIYKEANIHYENLTREEITFFEKIFSQINPLYLTDQGEIIVVKNISSYCDHCAGVNFRGGKKIVIKFYRDENYMKEVISHELLHTYWKKGFPNDDDGLEPQHRIIYSLGENQVAFKE